MSASGISRVAVAPTRVDAPGLGSGAWSMASTVMFFRMVLALDRLGGWPALAAGGGQLDVLDHVDVVAGQDEAAGAAFDRDRSGHGAHAGRQLDGHEAALAALDQLGEAHRLLGGDGLQHQRAGDGLDLRVAGEDRLGLVDQAGLDRAAGDEGCGSPRPPARPARSRPRPVSRSPILRSCLATSTRTCGRGGGVAAMAVDACEAVRLTRHQGQGDRGGRGGDQNDDEAQCTHEIEPPWRPVRSDRGGPLSPAELLFRLIMRRGVLTPD